MALIHCDFFSQVLGLHSSMYVILPEKKDAMHDGGARASYPTLYLLHGLSDDHSAWLRQTSIERYVRETQLAVVMPAVNRSFYTDMAHGLRYFTFISEELPAIARSLFPLSNRREENFVAGLSMGGYGALKLALRHPDRFSAAASLSGAVDVARIAIESAEFANVYQDVHSISGSDDDLFELLNQVVRSDQPLPKLFACCGTEDFLHGDNQRFLQHAKTLGVDITYEEEPAKHVWSYWDKEIQHVLKWLPIDLSQSDM